MGDKIRTGCLYVASFVTVTLGNGAYKGTLVQWCRFGLKSEVMVFVLAQRRSRANPAASGQ